MLEQNLAGASSKETFKHILTDENGKSEEKILHGSEESIHCRYPESLGIGAKKNMESVIFWGSFQ